MTLFTYETIHIKNSIMVTSHNSYGIDASMLNFPIKTMVGEFRKSLDKNTFTAYTSELNCQMMSCKGNCTYDEPSVNRLLNSKNYIIPANQIVRGDDDTLKRQIPVYASANLVIRSLEIDSLQVTPSYCKLSIENTIACIACDDKPTAIFKSYDIRSEGLLEF